MSDGARRVVLITGASSGLGREPAPQLSRDGAWIGLLPARLSNPLAARFVFHSPTG